MPEEAYWETLLDVNGILKRLRIGKGLQDVVELGCGYGTFSLPVAASISGVLRAFDIDAAVVTRTRQRGEESGIRNLLCEQRDVFQDGFGVEAGSQDACLLFNILHCEQPVRILQEAARVITEHGSIYAVHWRHDPSTPRGPSLDIRPRPEECIRWAQEAALGPAVNGVIDLPPYHYGVVLKKLARGGQIK